MDFPEKEELFAWVIRSANEEIEREILAEANALLETGRTVAKTAARRLLTYLGSSANLTLSLAGVTGIIVSAGVTVDSYIVYFERLKDEVRAGSSVRACADRAFQASDARLNDLYKQITARLKDDADTKKLLTAAQRSWVGFRDAECSFATSAAADGSAHPMLVAQCRTELTDKRAGELKTYLSCAEGDLSCPVPAAN